MSPNPSPTPQYHSSVLPNWVELCNLSDEELGKYDVAVVNLACAVGLPGAEVIDTPGCLKALDDWAVGFGRLIEARVESEFRLNPAKYQNSEPLFRMVKLVLTLQRYCGVRYDPAKIDAKPEDRFDLHEHFIHGVIQGPGGTCASLPVVFAAVARRLGYPIRLVTSARHMFCRWDDPATGERVNIEGATGFGVNSYPDEYYRNHPMQISRAEERIRGYLDSLTPREELAQFVQRLGIQWFEHGNYRRAAAAFLMSGHIDPSRVGWVREMWGLEELWERQLLTRRPPGFPKVEIAVSPERRRWPWLEWMVEKRLRFLEAVENVLNDQELDERCWVPMRAGQPPHMALPKTIVVDCTGEELCSTLP